MLNITMVVVACLHYNQSQKYVTSDGPQPPAQPLGPESRNAPLALLMCCLICWKLVFDNQSVCRENDLNVLLPFGLIMEPIAPLGEPGGSVKETL